MHLLLFCQTTDDAYISCLSDADKKKKQLSKANANFTCIIEINILLSTIFEQICNMQIKF
jgi:hypothetical protein